MHACQEMTSLWKGVLKKHAEWQCQSSLGKKGNPPLRTCEAVPILTAVFIFIVYVIIVQCNMQPDLM